MEVLQDIKPLTGVQRKLSHEHFENLPQGDNFSRRVLPTLVDYPSLVPLPELSQGGKPVYQNTISIAVDPLKLGAVCSWLTNQGVTAEVMTPSTGLTPEGSQHRLPGVKGSTGAVDGGCAGSVFSILS